MLADAFIKLRGNRAVNLIRTFIRSPWYLAMNVLLMVCAELFSLELPVFYIYFAVILLVFLFDEDMLGIMVLIPCHYFSISASNNPGKHVETLFSDPVQMTQLVILISVYAVLFTARLVSLLLLGGKRKVPSLTFGFLVLAVAFVAGGAASGYWGKRTFLFGLVEAISLSAVYFYFYFTVNWKKTPEHYGMMVFLALGAGLVLEIVGMYFMPDAVSGTTVNRNAFYTGWGIYNNVGCAMAICLPAPFYFAIKRKEGWIFSLLGIVYYLAVMLSQSRNAMLFGTLLFVVCVIVVLFRTKGWERWKNLIVYGAFALVALIASIVFRDRIAALFHAIGEIGFNDSARFDTYRACWKRFLEAPWFGSGFYHTPGTVLQPETGMWTTMDGALDSTGFLPPRAHNTLFQILASGGVFLLIAYLFHRVQTGILFFRRLTTEKFFVFLCVGVLLLTSLLDCHLFNFGPGLVYSALLVFAEGDDLRRGGSKSERLFRARKKKNGVSADNG